jgi:hypothetical protein
MMSSIQNYGKRKNTSNGRFHFHKSYIDIFHTQISKFHHNLVRSDDFNEQQHVPPCCCSTINGVKNDG